MELRGWFQCKRSDPNLTLFYASTTVAIEQIPLQVVREYRCNQGSSKPLGPADHSSLQNGAVRTWQTVQVGACSHSLR